MTWLDRLWLFLKGMAIGAAEVVPGVSGGTIAFITGVYQRLLGAIKKVNVHGLGLLGRLRLRAFFFHVDGPFLLPLLVGMLLSLAVLARLLGWALEHQAIAIWSFFFGLILASVPLVLGQVRLRHPLVWVMLVVGAVVAWWVTGLSPTAGIADRWFVFVAGAIAISALILPGISGSFLLLIMGQYQRIIVAVNDRDLLTLGLFGAGCAVGLLLFSRVVSWLLARYYDLTVALLAGFMLGSLRKIWPWKVTLTTRLNSAGEEVPLLARNVSPNAYAAQVGVDAQPLTAALFFLLAIVVVWAIHYISRQLAD